MTALPVALAAEAETLTDWFLHDPDPWDDQIPPHGELRRISGSIQSRRVIEIHLADRAVVPVRPAGLVLKAGTWHLVHMVATTGHVMSLATLRSTRLTKRPFEPPADFDLGAFWLAWLAQQNWRIDRVNRQDGDAELGPEP